VRGQRIDRVHGAHVERRRCDRPALVRGSQRVLTAADGLPEGVLGFERTGAGTTLVTLAAMSGRDVRLDASWADGWRIVVDSAASDPRDGQAFDGVLPADTAAVLERA
jgi:hypothetical protein